ncbi:MAG: glycosyl transferase family 90 [Aquabacterium sp.]|nr:glycosyl transferase family 90 [Aquabacterium sp.]
MTPQVRDTLDGWAFQQLMPWLQRPVDRAAWNQHADALNSRLDHAFIFDVAAGAVTVRPKPPGLVGAMSDGRRQHLQLRLSAYLQFFNPLVARFCPQLHCGFVMTMDDHPLDSNRFPSFAFQKQAGSPSILVPDIDALVHRFYAQGFDDLVPWEDKHDKAVFVGATTGSAHTVESVQANTNPRLRAGRFFQGSPLVDFHLPLICQCLTPEAEAAIRALGFGGEQVPWEAQFRYKFLLSLDGNGATCSRVQIALKSGSVLLKYDSPFQLYYFAGLQPCCHYLPVARDDDVPAILHLAQQQPHFMAQVARSGQQFFADHLNRNAVAYYTARLLRLYASVFGPHHAS